MNQSLSMVDMRYQEVLDNFAVMADNDGLLPSIAVSAGGNVTINNSVGFDPTTTWTHAVSGFAQQALNLSGAHNPQQQWTMDSVVSQPLIEGLRYAYLWALLGPPPPDSPAMDLLRAPTFADLESGGGGYHLAVADQLAAIPFGWLHISHHHEPPAGACYKAHHGNTYVWIDRSGLEELSDFTLVVLDIATINPSSLVLAQPVAAVQYISSQKVTNASVQVTDNWPVRIRDDKLQIQSRENIFEPKTFESASFEKPKPTPVTPMFIKPPLVNEVPIHQGF